MHEEPESVEDKLKAFAAQHPSVHEVYRTDHGSIRTYLFFPAPDGDDAINFAFDTAFLVELNELNTRIRGNYDPKALLRMETDHNQRDGTLIYRR